MAKFGMLSKKKLKDKCVSTATFKEGRPILTCTVQCLFRGRGMEIPPREVSEPRKYQGNKSRSDV